METSSSGGEAAHTASTWTSKILPTEPGRCGFDDDRISTNYKLIPASRDVCMHASFTCSPIRASSFGERFGEA